jgi:hypothetical protein
MPIVSKTYDNEEYLTKVQNLLDLVQDMVNGTFNQTLFNEAKSFQKYFLVNELQFHRPEGVNFNETLEKYVDEASDLYLEALRSANPPYTEEKHKTFNETIDKIEKGFRDLVLTFEGIEKLFRPEIQQLPIVQELQSVTDQFFNDMTGFKIDPTGYGDYLKDPKNIKLATTMFYLASQMSVTLANAP